MSLDATRWAWQQSITPSQKLVLLSFADRADEGHCCFPSVTRLEQDTGLDRKTIMSAIFCLESVGLIAVTRIHGSGNRYQLNGVEGRETSTKNGTSTKSGTSTKTGTTPVPKTGLDQYQKRDTNLPITNKEPTNREIVMQLMISEGASKDAADDYIAHRKKLKADLTPRAWSHISKQMRLSGLSLDDAISMAIARAWRGFEAEWVGSVKQTTTEDWI